MSNFRIILWTEFQALWLPVLVYVVYVGIMWVVSDQNYATKQWREKASRKDRTPLFARTRGYDADAVAHHWAALEHDPRGLRSQRLFLQMDLFFPLFYGTALAVSIWRVWEAMGKTFFGGLPFAFLVLAMIADWTENLTQLSQLRRFAEAGKAGLQPQRIQIASIATTTKNVFLIITAVLLIFLTYR